MERDRMVKVGQDFDGESFWAAYKMGKSYPSDSVSSHGHMGMATSDRSASCMCCSVMADKSGRIVRKDETVDARTCSWSYVYDDDGRLIAVRRDGEIVETYAYDVEGRRLEDRCEAFDGKHRGFAYNGADQLLAAGDVEYTYDARGRLSLRRSPVGVVEYAYDDSGFLKSVVLPNGRFLEYERGCDGLPRAKCVDGVLFAKYEWLDFVRLKTFHNVVEKTFLTFHYEDGVRVPHAVTISEGGYAYDCTLGVDQTGTVKVLADSNGDVIKKIKYDCYGNVLHDSRPQLFLPLGFAGGVVDRETGLVRFGWRDYLPEVGRFIAPDPVRWQGGDPDYYDYCVDDPVNKIDPLGLWPWSEEEETAPKAVWVWKSKPGACDKCKALDGTVVKNPQNPDRPHPNCKCSIIKCTQTIQYSDWKVYSEDRPRYEAHMKSSDISGAVCFVIWKKIVKVREKRSKITAFVAHDGWTINAKSQIEYKKRRRIETKTTKAIRWNSGTSVDQGDVWTANNPWTGETVVVRF